MKELTKEVIELMIKNTETYDKCISAILGKDDHWCDRIGLTTTQKEQVKKLLKSSRSHSLLLSKILKDGIFPIPFKQCKQIKQSLTSLASLQKGATTLLHEIVQRLKLYQP